jgi:hypothetical protein
MKQKEKRNAKGRAAKTVLRLPDLEVAKSAALNSLSCPDAQRAEGEDSRKAAKYGRTNGSPCYDVRTRSALKVAGTSPRGPR